MRLQQFINEGKEYVGYFSTSKRFKKGDFLKRKLSTNETEVFAEKIRKEKYPGKPSRIGALFVAPTFAAAKEWAFHGGTVYKVKITGKVHLADGEVWTDIDTAIEDNDLKLAEKYAIQYWKGEKPFNRLLEYIIDGKVEILGKVTK